MNDKVQAALAARQHRLNPSVSGSKTIPAGAGTGNNKVQTALVARETRMRSALPGVLSELESGLKTEIEAYNSAKPVFGNQEETSRNQEASRANITQLKETVNIWRKYMPEGAADELLATLGQMEQGYDTHLQMASFASQEEWDNSVHYYSLAESDAAKNRDFTNPTIDDLRYYDAMMDHSNWKTNYATGEMTDAFGNVIDQRNADATGTILHPMQKDSRFTITDPLGLFLSATEQEIEDGYTDQNAKSVWGNLAKKGVDNNWKHLKESEKNIYYALLNSEGNEKALQFLNDWAETLNSREGVAQAEKIKGIDNDVLRALSTGIYGLQAGADQFKSGVGQLISDEKQPTSAKQYGSAIVADSLKGLGKYAYQATTVVGNMLPSIAISYLTAGVGAGTKVAQGFGAGTMGASASGNAYGQALAEGYDKDQARMYGTLVGASEATLQYLIGGIGKLGGSSKLSAKILSKTAAIDNAFLRIAVKLGADVGEEIVEEELQNFLEPAFRTIIFGEDYDAPTIEEILETAIVTAISTPAMSGGDTIANDLMESKYYKDLYGNVQQELVAEGMESSAGSESKALATKYQKKLDAGKNLSGHQLEQLVEANEQQFRSEDVATIQRAAETRLSELGETENVAAIAKVLAKQAAGEKLSRSEQKLISDSKYGQRVANELNVENIRSGEYASAWAEKIGTERINAEEYGRLAETAQEQAEPSGVSLPTLETDTGVSAQNETENGGIINVSTEQGAAGAAVAETAGEQAGEGVLYGSSQRNDGSGTGEQTGSLAGRTRPAAQGNWSGVDRNRTQNKRRYTEAYLRLEKVSSKSIGIDTGTDSESLQVLPEEYWDASMREKAEQVLLETGKQVTYVLGKIEIQGKYKVVKVRGAITETGIVVRADAKMAPETIADHEAFHGMVDVNGETLIDRLVEEIQERFSPEELEAVLERYIPNLRGTIDAYGATTGEEYARRVRLVMEELLADAYAGINMFSAGAIKFTGTVNRYLEENHINRNIAQDNGAAEPTGPPTERFSIAETEDGRAVAVVDSDILEGIYDGVWSDNKEQLAIDAATEALKKFRGGICVNGITYKVNRTSRREYTKSNNAQRQFRKYPDAFADKMRAADVLDDVIVATTNWKRDGELRHQREDFIDFCRGNTLISSGEAGYSAEVVVGITADGEYVIYDIVKMMPQDLAIKNAESLSTATTNNSPGDMLKDSAEEIVSNNILDVKKKDTRYSVDNGGEDDVQGLSLPTLEDVDGETSGQKENTASGGVRYSVDEQFERLIDNWDGNTIGFSFVVGETSNALQEAGIPKKQIRWDASKIKTLLGKHNGMTMETVKQIPELLENPIIVIDSKKGSNSKIVMGDLHDEHGNIVTAVILLTPTSKKGNVLDILKISSAEGRSHINSLFVYEDGTPVAVRYVDKNRIQSWLNVNRLQLPLHNLDLDSTNSIDNFDTSVKERFSYDEEIPGLSLPVLEEDFVQSDYIKTDISAETIEADIVKVANMEPVAQITGEEFAKGEKDLVTQVTEFFAELNNRAYNPQLGSVILDRQGVRSDIAHGIGRKKAAAFAAVPDVLARGYVVDYQKNWKGRGYDTAVVAAPVRIGSDEYLMGIVLNRNQAENKFYVHEVLTTENEAPPFKTGTRKGNPSGDAPSILSILDRIRNVKANNGGTERYSVDDAEQEKKSPKKQTKPVAESKPIIAKRDLRNTMLNLFSVPDGQRAELGEVIDGYADRLLKNGSITEEDRKVFFDRMYDAGVMTVPAEEYWSEARSHIAKGRIYVSQRVKAELGDDWNDLRRRAFAAGVYLVNDPSASGIDQWNATLAEQDMLPGLFDAEDTDLRTILERIVQVAEEGRDEQMSLAEYTAMLAQQEYVSEAEILDNMERQMDWALRTFAEKAKLEIHLRDRTGIKIAQEREKGAEKLTMERVKDAQRRAEERQERKEMAQRQRERKELRELQQKTMKQLRWLSKNRYRAPEELQATWDEVLGDIDLYAVSAANEMHWSEKHQATWKDLAQMYKDAQNNDPNFLPSKELQMIVDRLDATKIADLDISALQDLYRAAVGLRTEFYNRNNVINDEMHRLFAEVYTDAKQEIENAPSMFKGTVFDEFMNWDQLTPMNILQRMGGWDPDGTFYSMAKQLEKMERDTHAYTVKAKRLLQGFLEENEAWVRKADGQGKDAIWYEWEIPQLIKLEMGEKPIFGDTVKVWVTPAQKVHMYLESKNVDNLRHMTGGRTFANKELYSKGKRQEAFYGDKKTIVKMAPETVKQLVSDLTAEEMELARLLEQYYNSFAPPEINRVSNILYGYDKAMGSYYAPIHVNENYTSGEIGIDDVRAEGVGHMKERMVSKAPSLNISAFDAFEIHVDQTARFCGMAIPSRNWARLMNWQSNNTSFWDVITTHWGLKGKEYITDLIADLQAGDVQKMDVLSKGAHKLGSNYISAVFGFNPSIAFKQPGSIPLASAYLGVRNAPTRKQIASIDRELIAKYTQELAWRLMGYSMPETKILKDNPNWAERNKTTKFLFGGGAITAMDGWSASTLWPWAENKVRKEHPELEVGTQAQIDAGESAFYKKVAEEFENAVARSQSTSDIMHQSTMRRSNNLLAKTLTQFKSDSAQTYNAIRQKIGEAQYAIRSGKDDAAIKSAKAAAGAAIAAMLLNAVWSEIVSCFFAFWKNKGKYYRDDEEEVTAQSVLEEMVTNMISSLAGTVVAGDELADLIGNLVTGDKWYGFDAPGIEQTKDVIASIIKLFNEAVRIGGEVNDVTSNGGSFTSVFSANANDILGLIKESAETFAMYFVGIPVKNVEAYLLGPFRWIPEFEAAYDDVWASVGKSDLTGLSGDALTGRIGRILERRNVAVSEETLQAISELYAKGEQKAVPTDIPKSVTIDEVEHKLLPHQQQAYGNIWSSIVTEALDDVVGSQLFAELNSEDRSKMLSKLYNYAAEKVKAQLFDEYEISAGCAAISEQVASGMDIAESIGQAVVEDYLELTQNGLDDDEAYGFLEELDNAKEEAGVEGLENIDKWRLSVDFFDDADDQLAALSMVMTDAQMINAEVANNFGVKPEVFVTFYEERVQYDANSNGSYTQAEIRAAIDGKFKYLSTNQKAALWQLFSSSAKNNPYSQAVGQKVLDAKAAMKNN